MMRSAGVLAIALAGAQGAYGQCEYETISIFAPECGGVPGHPYALSISETGRVCGYYIPCPLASPRAYMWTPPASKGGTGTFLTLPLPVGHTSSDARDISDTGDVVGTIQGPGSVKGYFYSGGVMTVLPSGWPTGGVCNAFGVHNRGQVVGYRQHGTPSDPAVPITAFIWSEKEGFRDLAPLLTSAHSHAWDIDDEGTVIGNDGAINVGPAKPFVYQNGKVRYLEIPEGYAGAMVTRIVGTNHFVGTVFTLDGMLPLRHAAVWVNDHVELLEEPDDARFSVINAKNEYGFAIGWIRTYDGNTYYCCWDNGAFSPLEDYVGPEAGEFVGTANDINARGQIVGTGTGIVDGQQHQAAIIASPLGVPSGDVDHNCRVNVDDLTRVILDWGNGNSIADLDESVDVDSGDLMEVIQNWSEG